MFAVRVPDVVTRGLMEAEFGVECERREDAPMDATLDTMHPLDPPPPDVLLALLARNKALEGRYAKYKRLFIVYITMDQFNVQF